MSTWGARSAAVLVESSCARAGIVSSASAISSGRMVLFTGGERGASLPRQIAPAATDEGAALDHEAPRDFGILRDADAGTGGDRGYFVAVGGKPQRAPAAQVGAVEGTVDRERLGQPPGPAGKILEAHSAAVALHLRNAAQRLERADEHTVAATDRAARDVQHERRAVDEIDIGVAAGEIHRPIARRRPAV